CGLASARANSYESIDVDFGIGIELEGMTPVRWAGYQMDAGLVGDPFRRSGATPAAERLTAPLPVTFPWRITRVIPGSPAQKAGIRPGDIITHLNGDEVTPRTAARVFGLLVAQSGYDGSGLGDSGRR